MGKRVAITGVGVNSNEFADTYKLTLILDGKTDHSESGESEILTFKNRKIKKNLSKGEKFFCHSAVSAVNDSGIMEADVDKRKRGLFLGTTKETSSREELLAVLNHIYDGQINYQLFSKAVSENMSPLFVVKSLPNACLHYAAEEFEIRGCNTLFITNGVASSQALAAAYNSISRGECIWGLSGGFDSHTEDGEYYNFEQYGLKIAVDSEQKNELLSDGAGSMVLEEYDHAIARGAKIYGEVIGHSEAFLDLDRMSAEGKSILEKAIIKSMEMAELSVSDIDFINIDGAANDTYRNIEKDAIKEIFSDIPMIDLKSKLGNLIGGASIVEIIADLMILQGKSKLIDSCKKQQTCMKISFGFGGEVSILILRRNKL